MRADALPLSGAQLSAQIRYQFALWMNGRHSNQSIFN
jgi:hypothetical protein